MSLNFATITGTQGLTIRISMEETVHAASVRKTKKNGYTSLATHPSMQINTEPPCSKKSKRTCRCSVSLQTSGQQYKKESSTSHKTHTGINQPAFNIQNFSLPNQESPPSSIQRTKLNHVDEHLQRPLVTQVAAIRHRACPLETAGL
jgi:hypothetical protein